MACTLYFGLLLGFIDIYNVYFMIICLMTIDYFYRRIYKLFSNLKYKLLFVWCTFSYLVFIILIIKDLPLEFINLLPTIILWSIYFSLTIRYIINNWLYISLSIIYNNRITLLCISIYITLYITLVYLLFENIFDSLILMNGNGNNFFPWDNFFNNNNFNNNNNNFNNNNFNNNNNNNFNNNNNNNNHDHNNNNNNHNNNNNNNIIFNLAPNQEFETDERIIYDNICKKFVNQSNWCYRNNMAFHIYAFPEDKVNLGFHEQEEGLINRVLRDHPNYKVRMRNFESTGPREVLYTRHNRFQALAHSNAELLDDFMRSTSPNIRGY